MASDPGSGLSSPTEIISASGADGAGGSFAVGAGLAMVMRARRDSLILPARGRPGESLGTFKRFLAVFFKFILIIIAQIKHFLGFKRHTFLAFLAYQLLTSPRNAPLVPGSCPKTGHKPVLKHRSRAEKGTRRVPGSE